MFIICRTSLSPWVTLRRELPTTSNTPSMGTGLDWVCLPFIHPHHCLFPTSLPCTCICICMHGILISSHTWQVIVCVCSFWPGETFHCQNRQNVDGQRVSRISTTTCTYQLPFPPFPAPPPPPLPCCYFYSSTLSTFVRTCISLLSLHLPCHHQLWARGSVTHM